MRTFDIVGIVCVAGWVAAVGAFMWVADEDPAEGIPIAEGAVDLREETNWMAVYRDGEDTGAIREDRTRLIDGWLVELQGIVRLDLMGDTYSFRFSSRTTLTEDLRLRSATGTVEAFGLELRMNGQFRTRDDNPQFHLQVSLEDSTEQFVAELEEQPRLAIHAIAEILAAGQPEEGDRFRQQFYDPFTLAPADLELVYEGRRRIRTVDGYYDSYDFTQSMGTFDSRIHADSRGRPLMHIFPMQIVMRALPDEIGPSHYRDFEELFEETEEDAPAFVDAIDPEDLLSLVSRFGGGELDRLRAIEPGEEFEALASDEVPEPQEETDEELIFAISPIPESTTDDQLALIAPNQHVALKTEDRARVRTGTDNPLWNPAHAPPNSEYTAGADPVETLVEKLDGEPSEFDAEAIAEAIADDCPDETLDAAFDDLEEAWPNGDSESDSYLQCLAVLADALADRGHAPHFVHGAFVDEGGDASPRVWLALYRDGRHLAEFDPLATAGTPGARHVQLYLDDSYEPALLGELVDAIEPD